MSAARPISARWLETSPVPAACRLVALAFVVAGAVAVAPAVQAQDQDLLGRIDRLQQELMTLQRHVYGGGATAQSGAVPSPDDPNRPLVARLELRLSQLEGELRRLTGQVEEVGFQIDRVSQRLDNLVADVDQRLQRLEQGGAAGDEPPMAMQTEEPAEAEQPGGTGEPLDAGPRILGSVPASDVEALRERSASAAGTSGSTATAESPSQTAALPGATPKEHYDQAFALLSQANYPAAEEALLDFLERYPDDPLAGNANYWLGETYYVRGQFRDAAVAFAEGFQRYPESPKAPDNLLKLGKSLAELGQSADACGTFAELRKRYPDAPATIHQQASSEQQRLSC